jgi:hypothetical protein
MTYTYSDDLYSDLHKDVFGCRPGQTAWEYWMSMDAGQKQDQWDYLVDTLREQEAELREYQAKQIAALESRIQMNITLGAGDRKTALRWVLDSFDQDSLKYYGAEQVAYDLGLPYNHPVIAEMDSILEAA